MVDNEEQEDYTRISILVSVKKRWMICQSAIQRKKEHILENA